MSDEQSLFADVKEVLFPSADMRVHTDDLLTRVLSEAQDRVKRGPVNPQLTFDDTVAELGQFDFLSPIDWRFLESWTVQKLEHGLVHVNHPRYFGLFNPAPTFPSQCADRIVSAFNPQLASATTSPAAVAIEAHVIRSVGVRAGLGADVAGHFTTGGSEANFTSLICALTHANAEYAQFGSRAFSGPPCFYVSQDCHLAWIKIAHEAGIGRSAVRLVPTNGAGQMAIDLLEQAIENDRASGMHPVMVVATAGTTNAGVVDPLQDCADIARDAGLWYHVDAAWGGALIASPRLSSLLEGIERADSITIDAHKWFATTMGCGMFLSPHALTLTSAFDVSNDFMPSRLAGVDPYLTSVQWSRRFLGLRLFLSLAVAGWSGYAAHVERSVALISLFSRRIRRIGWIVANNPALGVACVEPPPGSASVREIVSEIVKSGRAWVSVAKFEQRDVVRVCVPNGETSRADILLLVDLMEECRRGRIIA